MRNRAFFFFSFVMPLIFLFGAVFISGKSAASSWVGYILGAVLTLTVMGSFWGLSVQLVTFREQGILRRFRLAPVGAGPLLASSILSNYFLVLPSVAIEIIVCRWAFHMQSWGNLWAIFLLITFGSATFSAFGLIVASVTNTMQETQMINNLIWMGFLFLSGATVPLAVFPSWIQRIALFMPATYLATGLEAATTNLATASEVITDVVALAIGLWWRSRFRGSFSAGNPKPKFRAAPSFGCSRRWFLSWFSAPGKTSPADALRRIRQDYQTISGACCASVYPQAPRTSPDSTDCENPCRHLDFLNASIRVRTDSRSLRIRS